MRHCLSMLLLACFMLVSASVSYVSSFAHAAGYQAGQLQTASVAVDNGLDISTVDTGSGEPATEAAKDKCSCKEKSGATNFVCSVTLAFFDDAVEVNSPAPSKTRYVPTKATAPKSFVDELNRPPRTIF